MLTNKNLVELVGISTIPPKNFSNIKVMQIAKKTILKDDYLDITKITKITVKAIINNSLIFNSATGENLSLKKLSGKKLLIDAILLFKIQYISNTIHKKIQILNINIPVIQSIVLQESILESDLLSPSIYIEDVFYNILTSRSLYLQTSLFISYD